MHASLVEQLRQFKINLEPDFTGQFQRSGAQWFKGQRIKGPGGKEIHLAVYGDFSRGLSERWVHCGDTPLTPEEEKQVGDEIKKAAAENRKAREEHWEHVSKDVEKEWSEFSELGTTPYSERKRFAHLYGCRVEAHERGARLIVPARDAGGKLWGYQRIYSEKLSIAGTDKIFREGARKEGCFHTLGDRSGASVLYLCEGISTAVALHEAVEGAPVVSCFDAGNLLAVASSLRASHPDLPFVFCADHDQWPGRDGKVHHTGAVKAHAAAKKVGNARVVLPEFPSLEGEPTDFWDLGQMTSPEEVRRQVLEPAPPPGAPIAPLPSRTAKGKLTKPAEAYVANTILRHYGDDLLVQNQDVFLYRDGYWQWQNADGVKRIKQQIALLYGPLAGSRDVEAAYKYLIIIAPTPPRDVDLFIPQFWSANFKNGTLHFVPMPGGKPSLRFGSHKREDFHTTQLPYDFPGFENLGAKNAEFEKMLTRVWKEDADFGSKRRALAQIMGCAIMPAYTKVVFLQGKKGSGKSTVLKLINRLLDKRNVSRVDPSQFYGFNLGSMVGKLVNMVTDINMHKPIQDDLIKQLIDRTPFRIARKFQTDLLAPLPPLQIFGCNELPKSMEGSTGAYERRVLVLKFGKWSAEKEVTYDIDFDEWVWAQGPGGIVAFALTGLMDLIESAGHFHVPQSSREAVVEWDSKSDPLSQFLDALVHKELDKGNQYLLAPNAEISRRDFWECFNSWQENASDRRAPWTARDLCSAMRNRGFDEKMVRGVRFWVGVGMAPSGESLV